MSRLKGKLPFTVEWEDGSEEFTLLLDFNALCSLDERLPGIMEGQVAMEKPTTARLVVWAALQACHPGTTEEQAGDIITAYGIGKVGDLLTQAFSIAFPQGGGTSTANPPLSRSRKR